MVVMCKINEMIVLNLITFIPQLVRLNVMFVILIVGQSCVKRGVVQVVAGDHLRGAGFPKQRREGHALPFERSAAVPTCPVSARAVQYPPRRQGKRRRTHKEAALSPFVFQGVRVLLLSLRSGISAC